jgi:hypothetical protein
MKLPDLNDEGEADVLAIDFRQPGLIRAALIGIRSAFSVGQLVPQLIANAFNVRRAPDIETAVACSGVPCAFVRRMIIVATDAASPERETNHEIAKTLSRITKRPVIYIDRPENIERSSMRQLGMPATLVEGLLQHCTTTAQASAIS